MIATIARCRLKLLRIWLLTSLFTNLDATAYIGLSSFIAALIIGGTKKFSSNIYMKEMLVLRNENTLRNHNHIQRKCYAVEYSVEDI